MDYRVRRGQLQLLYNGVWFDENVLYQLYPSMRAYVQYAADFGTLRPAEEVVHA